MTVQDSAFSILSAAEQYQDRLAIRTLDRDYSFSEISELVKDRLKALKAGVEVPFPLVAKPELDTLITIYALLEKKIPILLLHPGLTENEKSTLLASIRNLPKNLPEDCAVILFTSGTTGLPKPAMLTYENLRSSAESSAANIPLGEGDIWQMTISPARIGGFSIVTRSLIARSAVSLPGKFSPEKFVELLESQKVTLTSIVPTMLSMILEKFPQWQPPKTLRSLLVGGSSTSQALKERAAALGIPMILTYGMTETSSNVVTTPYSERYKPTRGCGMPNKNAEIRSEEGQILIKGPMVMAGYWGREPINKDDWFKSGDLGYIGKDGAVFIQARRTDVILSGGENVYPVEVEEALERLPGIYQARVVGLPDETWGAIVTALLVPEKGRGPISNKEIIEGLKPILARYKSPRRIAWVDSLPQLSNGKPNRSAEILRNIALQEVHYFH